MEEKMYTNKETYFKTADINTYYENVIIKSWILAQNRQ